MAASRLPSRFEHSLPLDQEEELYRLCNEFEERLRAGESPRIEDYLGRLQPESRAVALRELLWLEIELGQSSGKQIDTDDYRRRFASETSIVDSVLEQVSTDAAIDSTLPGSARQAARRTDSENATGGGVRYRHLRSHAKGGLGEVFVAQDLELHREVALKEIQSRYASDSGCRSRFVREAEITGGLEHPGIVPVYGLGAYEDGRPYYAMRFIQGDNLKSATEQFHSSPTASFNSLEFRQLVGRFLDVCNAIGFAHSRGVLHRDLKPGNIMLGKFGETLVVDWGLAKVSGGNDASADAPHEAAANGGALETAAGALIGTPSFMSPEQASGKIEELGPATDIYSLGATFFFLLTNQPPFAGPDVADILNRVRRGDLAWPADAAQSIPAPLRAICRKAMARQPRDRYSSALALAGDLEKWLADEPVTAWQDSLAVRSRRWMRKHPGLVASIAASVLVGIVGLAIGSIVLGQKNVELTQTNQLLDAANTELTASNANLELAREETEKKRIEAVNERQIAQAVRNFLENDLLRQASPKEQADRLIAIHGTGFTSTENPTVKDLLDRAAVELQPDRIERKFPGQPFVQAEILAIVGYAYLETGAYAKAVEHLERTVALCEARLGRRHHNTLKAINLLANAYVPEGRIDLAIPLFEEILACRQQSLGTHHDDTIVAMNNLAAVYCFTGNYDKATPMLESLLDEQTTQHGPEHSLVLNLKSNVAQTYRLANQDDKAVALFESVLEARRRLAPDHPDTWQATAFLGEAYVSAGKPGQGLPLLKSATEKLAEKFGEKHPETLRAKCDLGGAYHASGRLDLAIPLLESAVEEMRKAPGTANRGTLDGMVKLATAYRDARQFNRALPINREAVAGMKSVLGADHTSTLAVMHNLAFAHQVLGQPDQAVPIYEETLARRRKRLGNDHQDTLATLSNLAAAYDAVGQKEKSLPLFEEALAVLRKQQGDEDLNTLTVMANLGMAYYEAGQLDKAVPLFEHCLSTRRRILGNEHPETLGSMGNLATAFLDLKQYEQSKSLFSEFIALNRKMVGARDRRLAGLIAQICLSFLKAGQYSAAEEYLRESLSIRTEQEPEAWTTFSTQSMLGEALAGQKNYAAAEPLLLTGWEGLKERQQKVPPSGKVRMLEAVQRLVDFYAATDKPEEAGKYQRELEALKQSAPPKP